MPSLIGTSLIGASATKNILEGNILKGTAEAGLAATVGHFANQDFRFVGIPVSIGIASSGWSDLAGLKIRTGVSKLILASAVATGAHTILTGQDMSGLTLRNAGLSSAIVVSAGLAHSVGSKVMGWLYPSIKQYALSKGSEFLTNLREDVASLVNGKKQERHTHYGQATGYC